MELKQASCCSPRVIKIGNVILGILTLLIGLVGFSLAVYIYQTVAFPFTYANWLIGLGVAFIALGIWTLVACCKPFRVLLILVMVIFVLLFASFLVFSIYTLIASALINDGMVPMLPSCLDCYAMALVVTAYYPAAIFLFVLFLTYFLLVIIFLRLFIAATALQKEDGSAGANQTKFALEPASVTRTAPNSLKLRKPFPFRIRKGNQSKSSTVPFQLRTLGPYRTTVYVSGDNGESDKYVTGDCGDKYVSRDNKDYERADLVNQPHALYSLLRPGRRLTNHVESSAPVLTPHQLIGRTPYNYHTPRARVGRLDARPAYGERLYPRLPPAPPPTPASARPLRFGFPSSAFGRDIGAQRNWGHLQNVGLTPL